MSETIEADAEAKKPGADIPNFAVRVSPPEKGVTITHVTFGAPQRNVAYRNLDLTDQWDLAELAGADPSPRWMGMTLIAASLWSVDDMAIPKAKVLTRDVLRDRLRRLGSDGMNAIAAALEAAAPDIVKNDVVATAKN